MISAFLNINKPSGPTSHDVIDELRKITGIKQIGHAGTLDPFARGVLIVGVGAATKLLRHFSKLDKKYTATLYLGATSDTYDREGNVAQTFRSDLIMSKDLSYIKNILKKFVGRQKQLPPMYSAKKIGGKKLYEFARRGIEIQRKPQEIGIYEIKLLDYKYPKLKIEVHCSSGTYIRTLAQDIGQALGCGAYLEELTRTAIGNFTIDESVKYVTQSFSSDWQKYLINFKKILCSGTFDNLHKGHIYFLKEAKKFGGQLIVLVARDDVSTKLKGHLPKQNQEERKRALEKLTRVARHPERGRAESRDLIKIDEVQIWESENPDKQLLEIKPDLICLGYDQQAYAKDLPSKLKQLGLYTKILRLDAYKPEVFKSSLKPE